MNKLSIIISLVFLSFFACSKFSRNCGLRFGDPLPSENIKGVLTKFELIGIADTTMVLIRGQMFGKYSKSDPKDLMIGTKGKILNLDSNQSHEFISDIDGEVYFYVEQGLHKIHMEYIGFNKLVIEEVTLISGGIYEFEVILGIGRDSSVFILNN